MFSCDGGSINSCAFQTLENREPQKGEATLRQRQPHMHAARA